MHLQLSVHVRCYPLILIDLVIQVTLGILEQAKALSIPALWLQPGAEDEAVRKYVNDNGLGEKVVYGCILVEGDGVIKSML